jgi:F-type H+-transporting ATPase subunit delta
MSADSRVAVRYAKSIVSLAQEKKSLEALKTDADLLKQVLDENRALRMLLKSPIIKGTKKFSILSKIFLGKVDEMMILFMQIICRKGREYFLPEIIDEIIRTYNLIKGIQKATVKSPVAITDEMRKQFTAIVEKISGKSVELQEEIDESLLGGFVLTIDDKQIDESVQRKLKQLRLQFAL